MAFYFLKHNELLTVSLIYVFLCFINSCLLQFCRSFYLITLALGRSRFMDFPNSNSISSAESVAQSDVLDRRFSLFFSRKLRLGSSLFWIMHGFYWSSFAMTSYLTLNLWYGTGQWSDVAHTLIQSLIGFVLILPMHQLYTKIWFRSIGFRFFIAFLAVVIFSNIWTFIRMYLFTVMTDADNTLWLEFGGWYFSSIFVFLGWTALYHVIFYYELAHIERQKRIVLLSKARHEKVMRLGAEKLASDARLQMLRYQLNPHFLFNTLNAISAYITVNEADNAKSMIQRLSHFLRYSLEDSAIETIPLSQDLDALKLYIAIEEVRFSDRLQVTFDIADDAFNVKVPSMILQPVVENALKFAVAFNEGMSELLVSANIVDKVLCLKVQDNGPGMPDIDTNLTSFMQFSGVGLQNIENRLRVFYNDNYRVNLVNRDGGGLEVVLLLPCDGEDDLDKGL